MWASMAALFTSPALFLLLNIVIVVIVFISRLSSHTNNNNSSNNHVTPLARALDRVKSIDFSLSNYNSTPSNYSQSGFYNHPQIVRAPSIIERVKSINFHKFADHQQAKEEEEEEEVSVSAQPSEPGYPSQPAPLPRAPSILERVTSIDFSSFYNRLDSGRVNQEAEKPESRRSDLKTSKSDQGKVTQRRKAKMKKSASELFRRDQEGEEELERRRPATMKAPSGETGDVDAKADDFINRFKQQLKLQRLDSLLRYKEMLNPK